MKVGLIDVDSHNFPNLALMKISAYHKAQGDEVEWWRGLEVSVFADCQKGGKQMREKMIELIRKIDGKIIVFAGMSFDEQKECLYSQIADHLIANDVTFATDNNVGNKWIPVTERLPDLHTDEYEEPDGSWMQFEASDEKWVIDESGYQTRALYEAGVVFQGWVGEHGQTVHGVTHWMDLPKPPREQHKHFPNRDCK